MYAVVNFSHHLECSKLKNFNSYQKTHVYLLCNIFHVKQRLCFFSIVTAYHVSCSHSAFKEKIT